MNEKIISGGQTGADRAALDFAIKNCIPHGGRCPKGRRSEDARIKAKYQLQETPSSNYLQGTEWNVRDPDGTVIVLADPVKRLLLAERFCFRGSVDDWINIGGSAQKLSVVLKKFIKHLGKESIFELF